jgi:hypothetical protein
LVSRSLLFLVELFVFNSNPTGYSLQGLKPLVLIGVGNIEVLAKKRGDDLKSKLLDVKHMARPKFFYHGLPN